MIDLNDKQKSDSTFSVDVFEEGSQPNPGAVPCFIGTNIKFSTTSLDSFCSSNWKPIIFDALVVAAAVEFCDRRKKRAEMSWGRVFLLKIPVHEPQIWSSPEVKKSLCSALNYLTGDKWDLLFVEREHPAMRPQQIIMEFPVGADSVMAFSDGMDSAAVAGLESARLGNGFVRVRVGAKNPTIEHSISPFTNIPYKVSPNVNNPETSARSRGFKFALVSALAAYLTNAPNVVIPESGQGALAPALLSVGQAYPDYRNYPKFSNYMEKFIFALLGYRVKYRYPRLWNTKGETLQEFVSTVGNKNEVWENTHSCWQQARHSSVSGKQRQCGICAACLLRRMSVHAAGLEEAPSNYVWENLKASSLESGAHPDFKHKKITQAMKNYALAGTLHFDHLASLRHSYQYSNIRRLECSELAESLGESLNFVQKHLDGLLIKHEQEWRAFVDSLGSKSFINSWINGQ